jgi:hypothetical protein
MKRKPKPQKADEKTRNGRKKPLHALARLVTCCRKSSLPVDLATIAAGDIGALKGHRSWLANTDGRSVIESRLTIE